MANYVVFPLALLHLFLQPVDRGVQEAAGRPLKYLQRPFMHVQLRRRDRLSSSHPFTMTSGPTDDAVAITVKEAGDFTSTIGEIHGGDLAYMQITVPDRTRRDWDRSLWDMNSRPCIATQKSFLGHMFRSDSWVIMGYGGIWEATHKNWQVPAARSREESWMAIGGAGDGLYYYSTRRDSDLLRWYSLFLYRIAYLSYPSP